MNVFVFCIETIPDLDGGRRLYGLDGLSDKEVANIIFHKRRQETGNEFLPLHLHRIVAISAAVHTREQFSVCSLGNENADEAELVKCFFSDVSKHTPTIVSWNGRAFDLPILQYRALIHGVQAPRYWEVGDDDDNFSRNNYLDRHHTRHTDLMDVMSGYESQAVAPLEQIAALLGLPAKMGLSSAMVWERFQAGDLAGIRNNCETDVLNIYLVYLRFEFIRGHLNPSDYSAECDRVRKTLGDEAKPHLLEYLQAWKS